LIQTWVTRVVVGDQILTINVVVVGFQPVSVYVNSLANHIVFTFFVGNVGL